METTTFTALAERAGRWWTVRVPQIEGLAVQVRSLDQAEMMARRHISEALHVPPESVRVEVRTEASVLPAVTKARQARQAAAQAAEAAARATRSAIDALLADGSTLQEAAIVLRLSPQEAAEFASGAHGPAGAFSASGGHGSPGGTSGGHDVSGGHGAPGGPRASHGHGDAEPPVGPGGLPQRTRSAGPAAVHH
ncbi:MAG: hypothetical protein JWM19_6086 [Actinomycetia bacterium]|nr:hypothetical protein [Actinomycetes bacterium]